MARIEKLVTNGLQVAQSAIQKSGDVVPTATKPIKSGSEKLTGALNGLAASNSALVKNSQTLSFSNISILNKEKISGLKNQKAIDFFNELNSKSPEKCSILLSDDKFLEYYSYDLGIFSDEYNLIYAKDIQAFKNAVDNLDAKSIEEAINLLYQRKSKLFNDLVNGIILYSNDKKALEYIIHSPAVKEDVCYTSGYSADLYKYILCNSTPEAVDTIRYNSVIEIEKGIKNNFDYSGYTRDSDYFLKSQPKEIEKMRSHLEQCIADGDFTAYRGEKSSWIFDSIPIDNKMQKQIRLMTFLNPKSRKDLVFPNNQKYSDSAKECIFDYIRKKDKLTLADAMLVARYGDKKFIDSVIAKINGAAINDSKFKSFTLSKKFAENWARHKNGSTNNNMVAIVTRTNVKKGSQVEYCAKSEQYEFIVNDNPKIMTFANAKFDKETNTFHIDSEIMPE